MEHVEGEWNGLVFRRVTEEMADEVAKMIVDHYFPDEHLTIRMGYSEAYDRDFQKFWRPHLCDGLSFAAYDKETNEMVALRVSLESKKDDPEIPLESEAGDKILRIIDELNSQSDVFTKYNVDKVAFLLLTCVHKNYRGRGIVTEMYRRSINLCRAKGY